MIVKVQLSIATNTPKQLVLIYNKSRSVLIEEEASAEIRKMMGGELKKFFRAMIHGKELTLIHEVKYQDW